MATIGPLESLGEVLQRAGKHVIAFCGEAEFDTSRLVSNTFETEWPPKSGRVQSFPEVDRAAWFDSETAKTKILAAQSELVDRLKTKLAGK